MVGLVVKTAIDMNDLGELNLFAKFKKLDTPPITLLSNFDATSGNVKMHVTGTQLTAVLKVPVAGTVDTITVSVGGDQHYALSALQMPFIKIQSNFTGNFEPDFFGQKDTITGSNFADKLNGFDGADRITGRDGNDLIKGGDGSDNLDGSAGNDTILGQANNDVLDGGGGADTLTGGGGNDAFLFNNGLNSKNVDTITDFKIGVDTIQLDNGIFTGIGSQGALSSAKFVLSTAYHGQVDVVVYDKAAGALSYALTGGSLSDTIAFAKVTAGLALGASDFHIV